MIHFACMVLAAVGLVPRISYEGHPAGLFEKEAPTFCVAVSNLQGRVQDRGELETARLERLRHPLRGTRARIDDNRLALFVVGEDVAIGLERRIVVLQEDHGLTLSDLPPASRFAPAVAP